LLVVFINIEQLSLIFNKQLQFMLIKTTKFLGSHTNYMNCPEPKFAEYAFIGRSNVGKSSFINTLLQNKKAAKVSHTPGKTQTINCFLINDGWYIADLPGYGYAKVSKSARIKWERMMRDYLNRRTNLMCVFLLVDSSINPQKIDLEYMDWLGEMQLPFKIIFTKCDRTKNNDIDANIEKFKRAALHNWEAMPEYFVTSSAKKLGREDVLVSIGEMNALWGERDAE